MAFGKTEHSECTKEGVKLRVEEGDMALKSENAKGKTGGNKSRKAALCKVFRPRGFNLIGKGRNQ